MSAAPSWAIPFDFAEFLRFSGDGKNLDVRTMDELQVCEVEKLGIGRVTRMRGGHAWDEAMRGRTRRRTKGGQILTCLTTTSSSCLSERPVEDAGHHFPRHIIPRREHARRGCWHLLWGKVPIGGHRAGETHRPCTNGKCLGFWFR